MTEAPLAALERQLLGESPHLTRDEVCAAAGVTLDMAEDLWHLLGFAHAAPDERAFTQADVRALQLSSRLMSLGVLSEDRQDGMVRTWGRSFARLAEWQAALIADVAAEAGIDGPDGVVSLGDTLVPLVDELQAYAWRRHLFSVTARMITDEDSSTTKQQAICFIDIVGYTSASRSLSDHELVAWLEEFEQSVLATAVEMGGRIIKNIGDELLLVADSPLAMAEIASSLAARGADEADTFPAVRAGIAYGPVVTRLGDVFGPVVNIAARLTSVARANTVLVDQGMHDELADGVAAGASYSLRRLPHVSVKGYSRLSAWALRPAG